MSIFATVTKILLADACIGACFDKLVYNMKTVPKIQKIISQYKWTLSIDPISTSDIMKIRNSLLYGSTVEYSKIAQSFMVQTYSSNNQTKSNRGYYADDLPY